MLIILVARAFSLTDWFSLNQITIVTTEITNIIEIDSFSLHPFFPKFDTQHRLPVIFDIKLKSRQQKRVFPIQVLLNISVQVLLMWPQKNISYANITLDNAKIKIQPVVYHEIAFKTLSVQLPEAKCEQAQMLNLQQWQNFKGLLEWLILSESNAQLSKK